MQEALTRMNIPLRILRTHWRQRPDLVQSTGRH
jgi:hypothetical protein